MALRPQNPESRADQLAKRDAAQQDVFLREVDDALRQDEMLGVFRRYGMIIGGVTVAALLALGGYLYWDHSRKQAMGLHGEEMTKAIDRIDAGHFDSADKLLAPVVQDGGGSGVAAKLTRAGIAAQANKRDQAVRMFGEVADDASAPKPFRDLATVRQIALAFDAMQPEQVVARLKPLAVPGNPWFGSAGEMLGIAYMKQGRNDLAGPLFAQIARDKDVPESLKRRARQMAGVLGVDAIDDVAKAAAGDGPEDQAPEGPAPEGAPAQ